jgi:hypothetical protein
VNIVAAQGRHHARFLLAYGYRALAWKLYRRLLGWNAQLGRWKFLIGFPIASLFSLLPGNLRTKVMPRFWQDTQPNIVGS